MTKGIEGSVSVDDLLATKEVLKLKCVDTSQLIKMESVKAFKRKMLLWTNNWFQEEQGSTKQFTPDAIGIIRLLQAAGFRTPLMSTSVECRRSENSISTKLTDCPVCRVILTCPKSGSKIELLNASTSLCKCSPSSSGFTSGTVGDQIVEAEDSTLTTQNDEISNIVSQVIGGLLHVMSMFPDLNHNHMEKLTVESTPCSKPVVQSKESATLVSNRSPMFGTPVTTTLDTPCIPKTSPRDVKSDTPGRYGSLDTLIASGSNFSDDIPEPGQLTPKKIQYFRPEMDNEIDLNATIVEGPGSEKKKFISNSSPAVYCTEEFQSSSTFNFESEERNPKEKPSSKRTLLRSNTYVSDGLNINIEDEPRKGPPPRRTPSPLVPRVSQSAILTKLQDLQSSVSDIIFMVTGNEKSPTTIDDESKAPDAVLADAVKKMTNDAEPMRSLSDFGGVRNSTRTTTTVRSIPRPSIRQRGTTTPGAVTPTTSKQISIASAGRRKSLSTTTLLNVETVKRAQSTTPKLGCQNRFTTPSNTRKTLTPPFLKTRTSSSKYQEKTLNQSIGQQTITPHRNYAHVPSTIPKSRLIQK